MQTLIMVTLGLLSTMWALVLYADQSGRRIADKIVADLPHRSAVGLYSAERISVAGTGVDVAEIAQPGSKYHYQYSGSGCSLAQRISTCWFWWAGNAGETGSFLCGTTTPSGSTSQPNKLTGKMMAPSALHGA